MACPFDARSRLATQPREDDLRQIAGARRAGVIMDPKVRGGRCSMAMQANFPLVLPIVAALCAAGCASSTPSAQAEGAPAGQSFPEAMRIMCNVDELAGLSAEEDPFSLGQKRTEWISAHVDNPDAIELRTLASVKGADEQAKMLRAKAMEAGFPRCPLADALEQSSAGGLSP
jgi:hypothetical protein